ncbi:MAG: hypothetical protein HY080_02525 [Gammaproteobacteria bacterium]|nr:hypothetical protein [Gammaproteobacteria bacterium]
MLNYSIKTTQRSRGTLNCFAEAANDANGNLTNRNETLLATTYTYDNLERLDTASGWFGSRNYDVDKNANRTRDLAGTTTTTYHYKPASNVLSLINSGTVSTDPNGNTTTLRGMALAYDSLNRLTTLNGSTAYAYNALNQRVSKTTTSTTTSYVYGLNGELLAERSGSTYPNEYYYLNGQPLALTQLATVTPPAPAEVILDNGATGTSTVGTWTTATATTQYGTNYVYTTPSTTPKRYRWTPLLAKASSYGVYVWYVANSSNATAAPYRIVHQGVTTAVSKNQTGNGGQWVLLGTYSFNATGGEYVELTNAKGRVSADAVKFVYAGPAPTPVTTVNTYFMHTDTLGTPRTMSDATKKVIWRWDSDPFGVGLPNDDPDGDGVKVTMNLRFPGQYYDQESGLHYNYFRYYDPSTGRYVTSDPMGLGGGLNTYGYVGGNPLSYTDAYGLLQGPMPQTLPQTLPRTVPVNPTTTVRPGPFWWLIFLTPSSTASDDIFYDPSGNPISGPDSSAPNNSSDQNPGSNVIPFPGKSAANDDICHKDDTDDPCKKSFNKLRELHNLIRNAEANNPTPEQVNKLTGMKYVYNQSASTHNLVCPNKVPYFPLGPVPVDIPTLPPIF